MRSPSRPVLIGTSGWAYADWRHPVYDDAPQRRWLELNAGALPTVEVNATFYRLPRASVVQGWADVTPDGFTFAVKVSRYLTHVRRLDGIGDGVARLLALLAPLRRTGKLGPLLWQLPPGFARDDRRLRAALEELPAGRHAFEFRDPSWFCDAVFAMLAERDVALVVADDARRGFGAAEATAGWRYVRLHYGSRGRRGNYSDRELETWAARLEEYARHGDVYAYFNNDWEAFAARNARDLARRFTASAQAAA